MKFDKDLMDMDLMYVPIWEPSQWGVVNNRILTILTLDHPCNTAFTKDTLDIKPIF